MTLGFDTYYLKQKSKMVFVSFQSTDSASARKKYGTDTNNLRHKPGGGNVKIFDQKVEIKNVKPRTDTKPSPKASVTSPRPCE